MELHGDGAFGTFADVIGVETMAISHDVSNDPELQVKSLKEIEPIGNSTINPILITMQNVTQIRDTIRNKMGEGVWFASTSAGFLSFIRSLRREPDFQDLRGVYLAKADLSSYEIPRVDESFDTIIYDGSQVPICSVTNIPQRCRCKICRKIVADIVSAVLLMQIKQQQHC